MSFQDLWLVWDYGIKKQPGFQDPVSTTPVPVVVQNNKSHESFYSFSLLIITPRVPDSHTVYQRIVN